MNYILFDNENLPAFWPLTYTRPLAELRCGILSMRERWEHVLHSSCSHLTAPHLQKKYPIQIHETNILINGSLFADNDLLEAIQNLQPGQQLVKDEIHLACCLNKEAVTKFSAGSSGAQMIHYEKTIHQLTNLWDIFRLNDFAIRLDFELLTKQRSSRHISATNQILGNQFFVEEGAKIECSVINTTTGPVYIGKDAEVMEGCMIRGPFALGEHSVLKMGAKIYGATTIGKGSKVGGEVNNSVFYANSNKAHDGFIGNSVIGEWCNLGADTNNSNLKNNYEEVKIWSEQKNTFIKTGLQFCGLIMGDHSKTGINTMLNTGTVIGVSCNVFGAGFPRNFIPSFSWGSAAGFQEYQLAKAMDTARRVFERRELLFDEKEQQLLSSVFDMTKHQR